MSEVKKNDENYIGYEYKDVTVDRSKEDVYADGYPNFGWKLEGSSRPLIGMSTVNLKLKRDRKIQNKPELTRLQRQFESYVNEIEKLEQSRTTAASIVAYIAGIFGTACLAGAVFSFLAANIPLCIILAVPGFIGWVLPYFLFLKISDKRIVKITPIIEQRYDSIFEVCEKAYGLSHS